jgi:hypothetical protein
MKRPPAFVGVILGHGDGTFDRPLGFGVTRSNGGVVIADFNGDGKPGIAVAGRDGVARLQHL